MANPENQLRFFGNGGIIGIGINPSFLSVGAFREIVRYQIYTGEQTEILVRQNGKRDLISREELTNARGLFGEERKKFLDVLAVRMKNGDEIIIKAVNNKAKEMSNAPPRKDSKPSQNSAFRKFIEEEMKVDL